MENKKTVEEIRKEIETLEEQEFELKYGLSKNQYWELKYKLNKDLKEIKEEEKRQDRLFDPLGWCEPKDKSVFFEIDIRDLKGSIKHLKTINKWHSVAILLLSISLILSILS